MQGQAFVWTWLARSVVEGYEVRGQLVMDAIRDQAAIARRPRPEYDSEDPSVRIAVRFGRGRVDIGVNLNRAPLTSVGTGQKEGRPHYEKHLRRLC